MNTKDDLLAKLENLKSELSNAENGLPEYDDLPVAEFKMAVCAKHGEFRQSVRYMRIFDKTFSTSCPCCIQEEISKVELALAQVDERIKQEEIQTLKVNSNIPVRFAKACFENYEEKPENRFAKKICRRYAETWPTRFAQGGGLVFCGKPGTGKNHLACAIANYVIEQYQANVLITTAMRIIRNVKSTWDKNSDMTEDQVIDVYCSKDLLIIDELGVQFGTDAEKIILFEIINERYSKMLPTILISNLTESELSDYIGERIIDRMREGNGAVVVFDWESYRK